MSLLIISIRLLAWYWLRIGCLRCAIIEIHAIAILGLIDYLRNNLLPSDFVIYGILQVEIVSGAPSVLDLLEQLFFS